MKEGSRFKEGNKAAQKWSEEKALEIFEDCFNWVINKRQAYCIHDIQLYAIDAHGLPFSSFNYLVEKYPVLVDIKKAMQAVIISRINKGCIEGDFNATGSIWRMKQLGERDPDKQEQTDALKGLTFKITQD